MTTPSSPWDPPAPEVLQGLLPQYEITEMLGRGGMGAVYKGRQTKLNRVVAIKLLPETFTQGDDELNFARRFEQEAQAMAGLDHPAIISVYDFGETTQGQLYFVMEFVDGLDIHQYLQHHGGRLPQQHALSITAHVLDALAYAHAHGIVHRDIKPANVMLNREGRVKIADFGLAKRFGDSADDSIPALTMTNMALGTPDYVAPEALDGSQVPDHRADLYAVGVMLYLMLTGKLPRGQFKLPSEVNGEIDPRLDEIVSKAMQTDPDDRYASAGAVRADLDRVLREPLARVKPGAASRNVAAAVPVTSGVRGGAGGAPKPATRERSNGMLYAGIGVALVVVIGILAMMMGGDDEPGTTDDPLVAAIEDNTVAPPAAPPAVAPQEGPDTNQAGVPEVAGSEPSPPARGEPPAAEHTSPPAVTPVPDPVNVAQTPPMPGPEPRPDPEPALALAEIPGFTARLESFLTARRAQLGELATKYGRAVESRLEQAADAGNLALSTAFAEEKSRVAGLVTALESSSDDLMAQVEALPALEPLPEGAPEGLLALREVWDREAGGILLDLDGKLRQSMQALEVELTRAREFEQAKLVLAWREDATEGSEAVVVAMEEQGGVVPPVAGGAGVGGAGTDDLADATKEVPAPMKAAPEGEGWVKLFNGENLDGWKVSAENPGSFRVEHGLLIANGPRAHLFKEIYIREL